jgi:hypothetical protein
MDVRGQGTERVVERRATTRDVVLASARDAHHKQGYGEEADCDGGVIRNDHVRERAREGGNPSFGFSRLVGG